MRLKTRQYDLDPNLSNKNGRIKKFFFEVIYYLSPTTIHKMSLLFRKLGQNNARNVLIRYNDTQVYIVSYRKLSVVPSLYGKYLNGNFIRFQVGFLTKTLCMVLLDGELDPAPKFFSSNVQVLLKRLTRPDLEKVFRKRTNSGLSVLKTPKYKFLTNEELDAEVANANRKAKKLLQMPPAVKVIIL